MDPNLDPNVRLKQLGNMAILKAKVNHKVSPKTYLRSAVQLEQQARSYYEDEDWTRSYVLSVRFCHLVLQELPTHPKYKEVPKEEKDRTRNKVKAMLERAEASKEKLREIFMAEYEKKESEELQQRKEQERRKVEEEQQRQHQLREEQRLLEEQQRKTAEEERHKLEQKRQDEIAKAAAAATITTQHNVPAEQHVTPSSSITTLQMDGFPTQQHLLSVNSVPPTQPYMPPPDHVIPPGGVSPVVNRSNKPAHLIQQEPYSQGHMDTHVTPSQPTVDRSTKPTIVDRSTKPAVDHILLAEAFLKGIETLQATGGLRMVIVPRNIDQDFLLTVSSNTRRNIETCGTLAGKLSRNVLKITHLIIPRQEGTPDSCVTLHEEEILEELDKHDLISLGWIHTHPSQTSFLSSIDMHMQFSYQVMLEEAIAIVVAPKYSQVGYYSLTGHGLDTIGNCQQTGFHPHVKHPPLFEDCKHVQHDPTVSVVVVDLRR